MTAQELKNLGYKALHTSWHRSYVSRKNPEGITVPYKGKFGKGFALLTPSWQSTQYCYVTYFVK